ncbi:MAG: alanine--glyoxylate aminotransferase family protein, partial [Candidatus Omnitrophica bacterium]|nr:alanine--glyoxylate aminotransferase family protein [Candidatus Omnitrophota bacterium]
GERWGEICEAYGVGVIPMDIPWGNSPPAEEVAGVLGQHPKAKAVFATLCETSTGVTQDIRGFAAAVKPTSAVLVVDAISGLGAEPLDMDAWGVDVVVSGSQKALMLPPGLGFIAVSPKAWKEVEASRLPKYYFSLPLAKKVWEKEQDTPFTPAISLMVALAAALKLIRQEGVDNIIARHRKNAELIRKTAQNLGLELYANPRCASRAVTAIKVPAGVDGKQLVRMMKEQHNITVAGGQAELAGKIFRIASMGYIQTADIQAALAALGQVLRTLGWNAGFKAGAKA